MLFFTTSTNASMQQKNRFFWFHYAKDTLTSFYNGLPTSKAYNQENTLFSRAQSDSNFQHYQLWCEDLTTEIDNTALEINAGNIDIVKFKTFLFGFQDKIEANIASPLFYRQMLSRLENSVNADSQKYNALLVGARRKLKKDLLDNPELSLTYFHNDLIHLLVQLSGQQISEHFLLSSLNFYKELIDEKLYDATIKTLKQFIETYTPSQQQPTEYIYDSHAELNLAYDNLLQTIDKTFDDYLYPEDKQDHNESMISSLKNVFNQVKDTVTNNVTYIKEHPETVVSVAASAATAASVYYLSSQNSTNWAGPSAVMLSQAAIHAQHRHSAMSATLGALSTAASFVPGSYAQSNNGTLNLSSLNGSNGFVLWSAYGNSYLGSGSSISGANDLNNDGYDDILVGAPGYPGTGYVIDGQDQFPANFSLANINGENGFIIDSSTNYYSYTGQCLGYAVVSAQDINNDGYPDIVLTDPNANGNAYGAPGAAYAIFSTGTGINSNVNVTNLNGKDGFTINGILQPYGQGYNEQIGIAVTTEDYNGDGYTDIAVSSIKGSGRVHFVYGQKQFPATINVTNLNGEDGFTLYGDPNDIYGSQFGYAMSSGNINGDIYADIIIGAPYEGTYGAAYVYYGEAQSPANVNITTAPNSFVFNGISSSLTGNAVSIVGDINKDGYDDIAIAAVPGSPVYIVLGAKNFSADLTLSNLNGNNGFVMTGAYPWAVSSAGDFNCDGYDDIVVTSKSDSAYPKGAAYIYYGHPAPFPTSVDLRKINATTGFTIINDKPPFSGSFGWSVAHVGDVNKDGCSDIGIGYPSISQPGVQYPSADYIVFGQSNKNNQHTPKVAKLMTLGFIKKPKEQMPENKVQEQQTHENNFAFKIV